MNIFNLKYVLIELQKLLIYINIIQIRILIPQITLLKLICTTFKVDRIKVEYF